MGVRGLTTYIANHHKKYLKNFKLHDCYVIIDGNSLACQLYVKFASRAHGAFGGDYDRYAQQVREFFKLLAKCEIKAIVIFDGGYETRKVKTVISRMGERIAAMKHIKPCSQDSAVIFPLFLRIVFKQVLREMNVPLVQCDFEADQEIASLAHKYNCPVMSYDSDFYIFDVNYIPIPLIEFDATPLTFELEQPSQKYCINCKIYKIDFFLDSFGGLDKSMLPLLASLLGNDYVKISSFKKFYSHLKLPKGKGNRLQKRIARVIQWLRNETFDSAVEKILGRMKRIKHKSVTRNIKKVINAYTNLNVTVEPYLPLEFRNGLQAKEPEKETGCSVLSAMETIRVKEDEDVEMEEVESEGTEDDSLSEDESSEDSTDELSEENIEQCDQEMDVEMSDQVNDVKKTRGKIVRLPEWLLESSRRGNLESCITDILSLRTYFVLPQIEDVFYKTSHFTSISLIKIICKLLIGNYYQQISLFTKNDDGKVQRFLLHFSDAKKITDLERIPTLTVDQRRSILLKCLDIPSEFCLYLFPEDWKLYVCSLIFWIKNTNQPPVTECHLISLCMSMIALSIIDKKVGFFRKKITFLKKYGKLQKRILKRIELGYTEPDIANEDSDCEINGVENTPLPDKVENSDKLLASETIAQTASSITTEDCIAVYEEFYLFHQLDENLKINKSLFSMEDIHVFAQFQSCLFHIMLLNSLLAFPFQDPNISSLYSGTFVYNLCIALKRFKNSNKYLESLLKYSSKIMTLICAMCSEIAKVAPVVSVQQQVVKKNRRKKRKKNSENKHDNETETIVEDSANQEEVEDAKDDNYYDENNAFSLLSSM